MLPEELPPQFADSYCHHELSFKSPAITVLAELETQPLLSTKRGLSIDTLARTTNADHKRARQSVKHNEVLTPTVRVASPRPISPSLYPNDKPATPKSTTIFTKVEDTQEGRTARMPGGLSGGSAPVRALRPSAQYAYDRSHSFHKRSEGHHGTKASQLFNSVGLAEFLQEEERPVFVVDLAEAYAHNDGLRLLFANPALHARPQLLDCVEGKSEDAALLLDLGTPFADFKSWVFTDLATNEVASAFPYAGAIWKFVTIRTRLRVITASSDHATHELHRPGLSVFKGLSGSSSTMRTSRQSPESSGYFDWRPRSVKPQTPGTVEALVASSFRSDSPSPYTEQSFAITSHEDASISDFQHESVSLTGDIQKHGSYIKSANAENLEGMSMDYLADKGFFDWTRLPMSPDLPDHIQFARGVDWAATSLGPIEEWSADLRGMCNLIMASPHPAAMYWGSDHVAIYNEAYILLAGQKHPSLMGNTYSNAWPEIWNDIAEVFSVAMSSAQATMKDDDCLFLKRNGFLEETYFSWSIIPLIGDDGSVVGLYNPAFEKTRRKIAERRMLTLREIGERTAAARAVSEFWSLLVEGFQYNEYDAPLVIIYSLIDGEDSDAASSTSSTAAASKVCRLEGTLGVEAGHPAAPPSIDLKHDNRGFGAAFKKAITNDKPIVLSAEDGTLDERLLEGVNWRGFGDPSRVVVVSPIGPTTGESTLGFLVMGTNPRRPYDEDYDLFVQLLGRQLGTSVASVVLFEEEIRKGERAAQMAAQDRIELSNQLAARTQEAVESENKFTRMAELAPVGMFMGDAEGKIIFANDAWYKISSFPQDKAIGNDWIKYLNDEDQKNVWDNWSTMLNRKCPVTLEFRFRTPWRDKLGKQSQTWVIASASPEKDEDGRISRIFGSITDISSQKFAEDLQKKRVEEAVERKRQQERYIDTTSHEMRNPLSAILQSADSISGSLVELRKTNALTDSQIEIVESSIDSAQTITLCAQHQKRIVDDVLTLSKLDSAMLLVTPVDAQPVAVVRRALKMFEGELQTADIALDIRIDRSYQNLQVDWVRLDPTRLSQVLINLTTNAIKFTTTQEKRTIKMHLAASKQKPSQEDKWKLTYIESATPKDRDVTAGPEWGMGEAVYIHFAVQDTGRGLTDAERKQLFQRFAQGNPRTHVHYGGSGLGLFISRELVELQGGEIGVASEAGKGSTFAFYVKARRSNAPAEGSEDDMAPDGYQSQKGSKNVGSSRLGLSQLKSHTVPQSRLSSASANSAKAAVNHGKPGEFMQVLVVEDNLINQKVLVAQLRKIGCTVYVANHGGEAIEQIKQSTFHRSPQPHPSSGKPIEISVVLMDLEMPIMDGQTCAREIRRMQESGELVRHVPVISCTANGRDEQIATAMKAGMDDAVIKPFRIPDLIPKMKNVIARFEIMNLTSDESTDSERSSPMTMINIS